MRKAASWMEGPHNNSLLTVSRLPGIVVAASLVVDATTTRQQIYDAV